MKEDGEWRLDRTQNHSEVGILGTRSKGRGHPRKPADISVNVWARNGREACSGRIRNISPAGVFIEMADPLGQETQIELEFVLPTHPSLIRCRGVVKWSETIAEPLGIGVELTVIGVVEMRRIATFLLRGEQRDSIT